MKSMVVQFHAEPVELVNFITNILSDMNIFVVSMTFSPFALNVIGKNNLKYGHHYRLLEQTPDLTATDQIDFYKKNRNIVNVEIGALISNSLEESCLSIRTSEDNIPQFALQLFKKLKKWTSAGAIAENPDTGAQSRMRAHRYTQKAKELDESGVILRPIGGTVHIHLSFDSYRGQ